MDPFEDTPGGSLAQALSYVAAWRGKRVVIKFGGRAMAENAVGTLIEDVARLHDAGVRPVLIHGGGPEISSLLEKLDVPARFVDGLRVTDPETMRVVEMVLGGQVNKRLVGQLHAAGARAAGLSGKDGGILQVEPHPRYAELGLVGRVKHVDTHLLETLLDGGYVPVLASLGAGPEGLTYNVNADTAAAAIAVALGAEKFLLLTDVAGVYGRSEDGGMGDLISELDIKQARRLIEDEIVSTGMIPKVEACLTAVEKGITSAHIISASAPHALLVELFTERGVGTMIRSRGRLAPDRDAL